jgi:serine protease AprX
MFRPIHIAVVSLILQLSVGVTYPAGTKIIDPKIYWIFFRDKGYSSEVQKEFALRQVERQLTLKAADRRAKVFTKGILVDELDLPVHSEYVENLQRIGIQPRTVSKWLNAMSASLTEEQYKSVLQNPFVLKIVPLARHRHIPEPEAPIPTTTVDDSALYGQSWTQAAVVNLPPVHELGYNGRGVMVGVLDAGFNNLPHICFDSLHVLATWDFVNGDSNVANEGDSGDGSHGTKTLSVLAGYDPGNLVGPAWGADFVLAKTENTEVEAPYEEDYWVAGLEWADSLGVEVISSSLSYMDWYTYEDMNGNTAVTTIAADAAAARGIAMFNSNGNIRSLEYDKMRAPADGDSVMGIGAVDGDSTHCAFSSYGPTYDGRVKPDLMAMGSGVITASPYAPDLYLTGSGTSFSCPMAAGIAALLLQANPSLTPGTLYQALKETASQATNPDTVFGWGIINALAAVNYVSAVPPNNIQKVPLTFQLHLPYPNPFNNSVSFELVTIAPTNVNIVVYNVLGEKVINLFQGVTGVGIQCFKWTPTEIGSGIYWIQVRTPEGNHEIPVAYVR